MRLERFHIFLEEEKEKIKNMSPGSRIRYIWDYYRLWILGIACTVFLLGYVIYRMNFTVKDYWFYAMFANTMEDGGNGSPLWKDFVEYAGFDTGLKKVEMNASSYFDPSVSGGTNNNYYQAFVALVESGDLDVVVLGREGLQGIGSSGRLMDLRDVSGADLTDRYADRLVSCVPRDGAYKNQEVPVGIDLSDSLLVTKYHLYPDDCVLGIGAFSKRPESVRLFLDFILKE